MGGQGDAYGYSEQNIYISILILIVYICTRTIQEYYNQPGRYKPMFHEQLAPHLSVIMNCMYWDERYPRLLTLAQTRDLWAQKKLRLLAVGDLSCDMNGAVEFLKKSTVIEKPFFLYNPEHDEVRQIYTHTAHIYLHATYAHKPFHHAHIFSTHSCRMGVDVSCMVVRGCEIEANLRERRFAFVICR